MIMSLNEKYDNLLNYLHNLGDAVVAYSGGVDSTLLLQAAREALDTKVLALTIKSPYIPDWEIDEAKDLAKKLGVRHIILDAPIAEQIKNNPEDRCYLCKTFIFTMLKEVAKQNGFNYVIEGTNQDDKYEHRPGLKALKELDIKSPLIEAGLNKREIRELSKAKDLPTWEKPAYACLLTRLPYNTPVSEEVLRKIEKSERFLIELGMRGVRVRVHDHIARIETNKRNMKKIFEDDLMVEITRQLKRYGFTYVTLDLEGYRTGSFDDVLKKEN